MRKKKEKFEPPVSYDVLRYDESLTEAVKNIFGDIVDKVYRSHYFYPYCDDNEEGISNVKNRLDHDDYDIKNDGVSFGCSGFYIKRTDGKMIKMGASEGMFFAFEDDEKIKYEDEFFK